MSKTTETREVHFHVGPGKQLITPKGIGIFLFVVLCLSVGIVTLVAPPVIIGGVLLGVSVAILIALYPYFGLLTYYVFNVVSPEQLFPSIAVLRPTRIFLAALLVSVIFHKKLKHQVFLIWQSDISKLFIVFLISLALSIPLGFWPANSIEFMKNFLWTFAYFILLINILTSEQRLKGFIWLYILAGGYTALSSTIAYITGNLVVAQGIERAESLTGTDPNTLAVTLVLHLPFMILAVPWIKNKFLRVLPIIFAAASILTIAITGSRSGVIGLVVTGFMIWLVSKKKVLVAMLAILVLVGGWFSLDDQYKERYSSIFSSHYDPSTEGRFDAWIAGLQMFTHNPITGIGVDNFPYAYGAGVYSTHSNYLRPHNMYVQIIAELGILGLLAFGSFIYYVLRQNFRLRKRLKAEGIRGSPLLWISYAVTISCGALFVSAIFGHSLFRGHWYFCAALTVVLLDLTDKLLHGGKAKDGTAAQRSSKRI